MESVLGMDHSKVELLDQMLLDLETCFVDAPGSVVELAQKASRGVRLLRNSLKCKLSEHVAQLARNGDPDTAVEALCAFFPALQSGNVKEMLRLVYVEQKDLASAIRFVEKMRVEFQQGAFEALYQDIQFKGHTQVPEMLLLQASMVLADESDTLKHVDEHCLKIIDQIVEEAKKLHYDLSTEIVQTLGSSILDGKMTSIVEKIHSAGTLRETLLLIKYSEGLSQISNQCVLIQTLYQLLKDKDLVDSKHGMHFWAYAKYMKEKLEASVPTEEIYQEKCTSIYNELSKNKSKYFKIYQDLLEAPSKEDITALHRENCILHTIIPDFVAFYYEGDLQKANALLLTARDIVLVLPAGIILSSLYKEMVKYKQLDTFEAFRVFALVQFHMDYYDFYCLGDLLQRSFEELQSMAPPCLKLVLWPEPAEVKFRLVNKFFNSPLFSSDSKVFCCLPGQKRDDQCWIARVDLNTNLVSFANMDERNLNSQVSDGTLNLSKDKSFLWRVRVVDQHHIQIFLQDGQVLTAEVPCSDDSKARNICLRSADGTDFQMWRVEPCTFSQQGKIQSPATLKFRLEKTYSCGRFGVVPPEVINSVLCNAIPILRSDPKVAALDIDDVADVVAEITAEAYENLSESFVLLVITMQQFFAPALLCKLVVNSAEADSIAAQDPIILDNCPQIASAIYSTFTQMAVDSGIECTKTQYDCQLSFVLQVLREYPKFPADYFRKKSGAPML